MKTAVEWLEEQFKKVNHLTENEWIELFNQAKEIEKQQIIDASNSDKYLTSDFIDRATQSNYINDDVKAKAFKLKEKTQGTKSASFKLGDANTSLAALKAKMEAQGY
jgi:hypothetical protein